MILLLVFAFIGGVVTILSPCILPLLPIILSSSADRPGKSRPLGVVTGFVASFTFFTLFLSTIVKLIAVPAESLRFLAIAVLIIFGITLVVPKAQELSEKLFAKLASFAPKSQNNNNFVGGLVIGLSLGLLWTPCVGPILASVISLALAGEVTLQAFLVTLAYSMGTAIPMFLIMLAGSRALARVPWLAKNTRNIQKVFGYLMILTAVGIYFGVDRRFQEFILDTFPNYAADLTQIENNQGVRNVLRKM